MLQRLTDNHRRLDERFDFARFFEGRTYTHGVFEDRFGKTRRRLQAEFNGEWLGSAFLLHEDFSYCDGSTETRTWRIRFDDQNCFTSSCPETIGHGTGRHTDYGCNHKYAFRLSVGRQSCIFNVDEQYHWIEPDQLLYRARLTKWRVLAGTIIMSFSKDMT